MTASPRLLIALGLAAVAAAAVVVALAVVGGPGSARRERTDEVRVREVVELVDAVERHRIFTGKLPETLEDVRPSLSGPPPTRDPETGLPYDYEILGERRFRVCARVSSPDAALAQPGPVRLAGSRRVASVVRDSPGERLCWESAEPPD